MERGRLKRSALLYEIPNQPPTEWIEGCRHITRNIYDIAEKSIGKTKRKKEKFPRWKKLKKLDIWARHITSFQGWMPFPAYQPRAISSLDQKEAKRGPMKTNLPKVESNPAEQYGVALASNPQRRKVPANE